MTTPRDPDGPYRRDPYRTDPQRRYRGERDDDPEVPGWRRPAQDEDEDDGTGGWGRPAGYGGSPGPYGSEPEYGWQRPEYEPAGGFGAEEGYGGHHAYEPSWGEGLTTATAARGSSTRRAARRRRRPPWIPVTVLAVLVVAFLILGFVVPGWFVTRVLDSAAVQNGIVKILTEDYGVDGVTDVHCPEKVQVTVGASFTCDAAIDGDPVKVPIRVTGSDGAYEVGRPT